MLWSAMMTWAIGGLAWSDREFLQLFMWGATMAWEAGETRWE